MQEAAISLSFKMYTPQGVEVMITMREGDGDGKDKACFERTFTFMKNATEKGWQPVTAPRAPQPQQTQPQPAAPAQNGAKPATTQGQTGNTFTANILCVEFNPKNGEKVAKLKGGQWAKHGVRLWPEVAEALGFDLAQYQAGDHQIQPLNVCYVLNDKNQPAKITGRAV